MSFYLKAGQRPCSTRALNMSAKIEKKVITDHFHFIS
jgi:hypothetical protein